MNKIIELEGKTNDLLTVGSPDGQISMKATRLVDLNEGCMDLENNELIDVAITSTNGRDEHPTFDRLLNKTIRITVEIVED